jgi:hypothetical protein
LNAGPLRKIDVAEEHILSAIQMIALEMSAVSSHLVVKAAEEIVLKLARRASLDLPFDLLTYVRPARRKEVQSKMVELYNFFKHADRDPDAILQPEQIARLQEVNDIALLMAIQTYRVLGGVVPAYMALFSGSICAVYPSLITEATVSSTTPEFQETWKNIKGSSRSEVLSMLRTYLKRQRLLPTL